MGTIFFDTSYTTFPALLLKTGLLLLVSALLLYVIYFVLVKMLFRKSRQRKELNLRLAFLWAVLVYFIIFNAYLFLIIYRNGIDSFHWTVPGFYLGITAQIIIYVLMSVFFFTRRGTLKKIINGNSIN